MPLKNAVAQGYMLVKPPPKAIPHFYGREPFLIDTLHKWVHFGYRYENFRFAAGFWAFWISAFLANRKQRALRAEWEANMQIQKKLHPKNTWSEEEAQVAAKNLGRKIPGHLCREFEGGYQQFDLKPKMKEEGEGH
uniref:Uncharacterized protein n=1 Tax=Eutreptiella gymnastica TaxID=73025 RepID=A0A7S4GMJ7_9EUGL|eukprot:CAMPEP_0174284696 /NCGR_PEP_ID=MMETSP0809-20121228/6327_1 /TAXON_ID=73025 ORGANISM="Eutreptiella gymnastica-like, Strain CCMP1594" /NCGR_SAMPLE_ID=MMETSP0809 /ASSEMBLY_ACC=CAM_ASM_000658 /LENGTH=135 /DNA_ID=CAMNT_0015380293 /DNA_START=34 /DNA_END=441 /DNA_ORIENTATION=+